MGKKKTNTEGYIEARGVRVHNLKNIDVKIPRGKLVTVTGLSGSGKSSLVFDTLYAEGQRRYVESLSAYARQFLGRMSKPEVDFIKGIPPAIAIEQKVNSNNPRSTVGTSTEIYDYLRLLFARVGDTFSPVSGEIVKRDTADSICSHLLKNELGARIVIVATVVCPSGRTMADQLLMLQQQGFSRVEYGGDFFRIEELLEDERLAQNSEVNIIIDRLKVDANQDSVSRMTESLELAFYEGHGRCEVKIFEDKLIRTLSFSSQFEADGIVFEEPTENTFAFNNPVGACPSCEGFGKVLGIDPDLVIPDKSKSIVEGAVACWRGDKLGAWRDDLIRHASAFDFPVHRPYGDLSREQRELVWTGNKYFLGLNTFFKKLEAKQYKIQNRVMLARYRGKTDCPDCYGTRLKKEAGWVKVGGRAIHDLVLMSVSELKDFFQNLSLSSDKLAIAERLLLEINKRLLFLNDVGLGYLTLNRLSSSLSGGESQRINLATSLGSSLVGSLYILDEPSIGLHGRDTARLIKVLQNLKDLGNTVVVVEHDEDIMRASDELVDIGPLAGSKGGELVFQGGLDKLEKAKGSLTADYLCGRKQVAGSAFRRKWNNFLSFEGAQHNNLKNIDVQIPLNVQTVVTGVSGSGKTSLVKNIIYPALKKYYGGTADKTGVHKSMGGDLHLISDVEFVNQNPIGKSSRSNPATYLKAYDDIRKLFAEQPTAKLNNCTAGSFSFNTDGGRCDECKGEGTITVEMQFMADINLPCDSCGGKRFKREVLDVTYRDKNIDDILNMTVDEAVEFFAEVNKGTEKRILKKIKALQAVGLGYIQLGQASSTLSGGESQRVKLAFFLSKESANPMLFVFDEPTTGLHFHDIHVLQEAFNALIRNGHTVLIIEHNTDIIRCSDWLIDLGPEGGDGGGQLVFAGTPDDVLLCKESHTGTVLRAVQR